MKRWLTSALLGIIITLLHLLTSLSQVGDNIEPKALDLWSQLRGSKIAPQDIVLISMDEASYKNLNIPLSQAWPRKIHAELLNKLSTAGVKRVVFDVLFLDPGNDSKIDSTLSVAMSKVPTVLGTDSIIKDYSSASGSFKIEEVLLPHKPFLENAERAALVGFPEDDGFVRRFLTDRSAQTKNFNTLSEAAAGISNQDRNTLPGPRDFINYLGPKGTIPFISYYQAIDKDHPIPNDALKDKIVFIGLLLQTDVGPSQKDVFMTPFGRIFGTEIHATAALNLIHKDWIKRGSAWLEILTLSLVTFLLTTTLFALRPLWATVLFAGTLITWIIVGYMSFLNNIFIPGTLLVSIFLPITLLLSTLYYYFVTRKAELKLASAFELYVSPQMAKSVANNQKSLSLGGEKVWATAMFTDIQAFTSISENMPAEQVSAMLNAYFTEVMDVVFNNDGTLLKFIGDAIFVIWGAPVKINDHASKACQTALAIQKEVHRFNESKRFPPLLTRIGIHTGPMVVGNLGSSKRFDYTAIGDSVNLASRIEGINKFFGTYILISETVKKEVGGTFSSLVVGSIKVAGKDEAVTLYILLEDPLPESISKSWEEAIIKFKSQKWSEAETGFKSTESLPLLSKASKFYLKQIANYLKDPPPSNWQGDLSFIEK